MKRYEMTLPWPPSNNTYYTVARGRKILSAKGRKYKKETKAHIEEEIPVIEKIWFDRIHLTILAYVPDDRDRDLDNLVKPIQDVLKEVGIYRDDSQIDQLLVKRGSITKGGYCRVIVGSLWE